MRYWIINELHSVKVCGRGGASSVMFSVLKCGLVRAHSRALTLSARSQLWVCWTEHVFCLFDEVLQSRETRGSTVTVRWRDFCARRLASCACFCGRAAWTRLTPRSECFSPDLSHLWIKSHLHELLLTMSNATFICMLKMFM